jgi:hypothetical protein
MTERWQADDDKMRQRGILAERVGNQLSRNEEETGISFFGDAERFQIITYSPPLVRKLLQHEYAKIEAYFAEDGGGRVSRVSEPSAVLDGEDNAEVGGLRATLPVGARSGCVSYQVGTPMTRSETVSRPLVKRRKSFRRTRALGCQLQKGLTTFLLVRYPEQPVRSFAIHSALLLPVVLPGDR